MVRRGRAQSRRNHLSARAIATTRNYCSPQTIKPPGWLQFGGRLAGGGFHRVFVKAAKSSGRRCRQDVANGLGRGNFERMPNHKSECGFAKKRMPLREIVRKSDDPQIQGRR